MWKNLQAFREKSAGRQWKGGRGHGCFDQTGPVCCSSPMKSTISISQAQAQLPKIARGDSVVGITQRQVVVGFYVPREIFESLLETMEVLANPRAMKAVRNAKARKGKYIALDDAEKKWGLK
jgi:PHD/YefM family antitoxin component YafN of YafNO toxin-antitoxin module